MTAEKFLRYEVKKVPASVKKFTGKSDLEKILNEQIERKLKLLDDDIGAKKYMDIVKHPNKDVNDYKFHHIPVDKRNILVSAIEFNEINPVRGVNVSITLKNFDITEKNFKKVVGAVRKRYSKFNPEWINFFQTGKTADWKNIKSTDYFVTGHINSIKAMNKPERYDEVKLERVTDLSFYKRYYSEYKKLKQSEKMFESERIETRGSLEKCLSKGFVHKVIIDGKFAGIHAVVKTRTRFCQGYYVVEKVMFEKFRRKNFGAAVQRKVIDSLPAGKNEFVFGNIYPGNLASLNTAKKCGRYIAGTHYKIIY